MHTVLALNGEPRPTTLRDARKLGLLPSVTTVLKVLNKPELTNWLIEQSVLAAVTSPRLPGEADDAFIHRVLHEERQQDQEAKRARELGTRIHDALAGTMQGRPVPFEDQDLVPWIDPVYRYMRENAGTVIQSETPVVGNGYAGCVDLITRKDSLEKYGTRVDRLWDYKSTKNVPDKPWPEARLQLAAYAVAWDNLTGEKETSDIIATNVYISTTEPGKFAVFDYTFSELYKAFTDGFEPLLKLWMYLNNYQTT